MPDLKFCFECLVHGNWKKNGMAKFGCLIKDRKSISFTAFMFAFFQISSMSCHRYNSKVEVSQEAGEQHVALSALQVLLCLLLVSGFLQVLNPAPRTPPAHLTSRPQLVMS